MHCTADRAGRFTGGFNVPAQLFRQNTRLAGNKPLVQIMMRSFSFCRLQCQFRHTFSFSSQLCFFFFHGQNRLSDPILAGKVLQSFSGSFIRLRQVIHPAVNILQFFKPLCGIRLFILQGLLPFFCFFPAGAGIFFRRFSPNLFVRSVLQFTVSGQLFLQAVNLIPQFLNPADRVCVSRGGFLCLIQFTAAFLQGLLRVPDFTDGLFQGVSGVFIVDDHPVPGVDDMADGLFQGVRCPLPGVGFRPDRMKDKPGSRDQLFQVFHFSFTGNQFRQNTFFCFKFLQIIVDACRCAALSNQFLKAFPDVFFPSLQFIQVCFVVRHELFKLCKKILALRMILGSFLFRKPIFDQ